MCTAQHYNPPTHLPSRVVPEYQHSYPVVPIHPHQSTPIQYPHHGGSNYYATAAGGRDAYVLDPTLQGAYRSQQSEPRMSHTSPTKLTDDHHSVLLRHLTNHAAAWRVIGTHLGFHPGELANIEASPNLTQRAPVSWLSAMLAQWLQWAPGDSRGSPSFATLEDLKSALNQAGLGATAYYL